MSFRLVEEFEQKIADFFGAPYCVATDCCTHAIELSLRYSQTSPVKSPINSYISVPFTFMKLGLDWRFVKDEWHDYYYVAPNVIDGAVYWKQNGYIQNTFMCISFQFRKHLSLGKGGCILLDSKLDYESLKAMSYDGRSRHQPWAEQDITNIGFHYYMTPETAALGLDKLESAKKIEPKKWDYRDYPDLTTMSVFNDFV